MPKNSPSVPRKCIFCGSHPVTKEHVWSKWTYQYLPRRKGNRRHTTIRSTAGIRGVESSELLNGHANTQKVRAVCKNCNNGWMSTIEEQVKPILIPLILDSPCTLSIEGQRILATWITMKCMVYEQLYEEGRISRQPDRDFLKEKMLPPDFYRIWIARQKSQSFRVGATLCAATLGSIRRGSSGPITPPSGDFSKNTQTITIGFGHLVVHVVASRVPGIDTISPATTYPPIWTPIWPKNSGHIWKSTAVISDEAIGSISFALDRFLRRVPWLPTTKR